MLWRFLAAKGLQLMVKCPSCGSNLGATRHLPFIATFIRQKKKKDEQPICK